MKGERKRRQKGREDKKKKDYKQQLLGTGVETGNCIKSVGQRIGYIEKNIKIEMKLGQEQEEI